MKQFFFRLALILLAVGLMLAVLPGYADFGDFSGDSDFGGSDWSSSDSDWGSSDSDWDYSDSDSGSDREMSPAEMVIWGVLGVSAGGYYLTTYLKSKSGSRSGKKTESETKTYTWGFRLREGPGQIPGFDAQAEREACCGLYRRMQDAWGAGDMSSLRDDFTPDAYAQYERQLKQKNARGEHAHCEVLSVSAQEMGWNENDHEWMLAVEITAVIRAWNEDGDGKVISGSPKARKEMHYAWVLRKPKTETGGIQRCPNCGHKVNMNAGAVCTRCGAPLTAPGAGWQLSSIQAISQRTL